MIRKIKPEILIQEGVKLFDLNSSYHRLATIELVTIVDLIKQIRIVAVQSMFSILDQLGHEYNADTFSMKDFDKFARYEDGVASYVCNSINEIDLYFKFYDPKEYKEEGVKDYLYYELYRRYKDSLSEGFKYYEKYAPDKFTELDVANIVDSREQVKMAKYLNEGLHSGKIISSKTNPNKPKKNIESIYDKFLTESLFDSGFGGLIIPTDFHIDPMGNAPTSHFLLEAFISPHTINEILKISGIEEVSSEEPVKSFSIPDEELEDDYEYDYTENGEIKINTLSKRENLLIELKHIFTTDFPGALSTYEEIKHKSTDQLEVIYNTLKGDK